MVWSCSLLQFPNFYSFLIGRILYIYFSGATAKVGDPASIAFFSNFLRNIEPDWLNSRFFDFFHFGCYKHQFDRQGFGESSSRK